MAKSGLIGARSRPRAGSRGRLRRQILQRGAENLGDAELLALWLGLKDAGEAEAMIATAGGLHALLCAGPGSLIRLGGLGEARAARLIAAMALLERQAMEVLDTSPVLSCTASVRRYLRCRLARLPREVFGCLFLDSRHHLIAYEALFMGTVDRASVHPREILRRALELNAAALILAHNHPSGVAEPSSSDVVLTRDVADLLARVDVRVLDHLVVGRGSEVSFAERGLL
jgi:DNA repair protein RadC